MRYLWRLSSKYERTLIVLFLLTIPFVRLSVFSDGVGYYSYLRSVLIEHNLKFSGDWHNSPNDTLRACRRCPIETQQYWDHPANELLFFYLNGQIYFNPLPKTGYLPNFYSVGPAILWAPFVSAAHLMVLVARHFGSQIQADGHSWPYVAALSWATALYGFLGLWLSFQLAKKYVGELWAFWATVGIWFASSLPVTMYVQPSWSHTHSAFCVALFLWYWDRTGSGRTWKQWTVLGLISGLMVEIYLANGVFLLVPLIEGLIAYSKVWREPRLLLREVLPHLLFAAGAFVAFLPMLITRQIIFGTPFKLGMYAGVPWNWKSPEFLAVLFSEKNGLFVCTPILILAVLGVFALKRFNSKTYGACLLMVGAFYGLISVYPWWHGVFGLGNRFFISLTPVFILGLAAAFSWAASLWGDSGAAAKRLVPLTLVLVLWNLGLVYQWSHFLFYQAGPGRVDWSDVLYNQFHVVPEQLYTHMANEVSSWRLPNRP